MGVVIIMLGTCDRAGHHHTAAYFVTRARSCLLAFLLSVPCGLVCFSKFITLSNQLHVDGVLSAVFNKAIVNSACLSIYFVS